MTKVKMNDSEMEITIPINGMDKLIQYEQGIRGLLRKVEVGNCDPELLENIKLVYELLSQLKLKRNELVSQNKAVLQS